MRKMFRRAVSVALSMALVVCMDTYTSAKAASLKLNKKNVTIKVGKTVTLKVKGKYKGKVKWTTSKKKVATVSSKGVVKGISKGKAVITAKVAGKKMKCNVKVNPKNIVTTEPTTVPTTAPTTAPTTVPTTAPTTAATTAPTTQPTSEPPAEPTATPKYMSEGAFVYDKLDISWIVPEKPMVAFTFDDGPIGSEDTSNAMVIQKALAKYNFHATFNYITGKITNESTKQEILAAVEAGHEIGNHTTDYSSLLKFESGEAVAAEIEAARKALSELTGIPDFTLRPPNLETSDMVFDNCNVPLIHCSISTDDWMNTTTKDEIIQKAEEAKDGDIILMHETNQLTAEAMEELVEYFHEKGFQIVSVVELFAAKDIPLYPGVQYKKAEYKEPRK